MLDSADGICAWMLFSSGSTPWSGDDWRKSPQYIIFLGKPPHSSIDTWSAADVQGAVAAVPHRIEKKVGLDGPVAALDDWIVVGH